MLIRFRAAIAAMFCAGVCVALVGWPSEPVFADDHLPIITLSPTIGYGLSSDAVSPGGGPKNPGPLNGDLTTDGSVTLPIIRNLSLSYDKVQNGAYDSPLSSIAIAGHTVYPGGSRDILQTFRADYTAGHFTVEGGFGSRYRQCCPADFIEWHKGFLGVRYMTRRLAFLHDGFFIFGLTANGVHHFSSPQALSNMPAGLGLPNREIFTTTQFATAVVPISRRARISTATTFLWGALDFPQNGPFPQYYDVVITSASKQVTRDFGLTLTITNVKQRIQGFPFPAPNAIRTSALTLAANFKLDLNRVFETSTHPVR